MYIRVDPSQSALSDLYVIDEDPVYAALFARTSPACASGYHQSLPAAIFIVKQPVTCIETGSLLNTMIYKL